MTRKSFFRPGDLILIVLLLAGSVAISAATLNRPVGEKAIVTVDGKTVAVVPVGKKVELSVKGPLGETLVVGDEQGVRITESPCPHKLCVGMGKVQVRGQTILCVPNHVAIRVEGEAGDGVDGVTG